MMRHSPEQRRHLEGSWWQHRKGGLYRLLKFGTIEADLTPAVIYESHKDGMVWVRPYDQFMDGRFTQVPSPFASRDNPCSEIALPRTEE